MQQPTEKEGKTKATWDKRATSDEPYHKQKQQSTSSNERMVSARGNSTTEEFG